MKNQFSISTVLLALTVIFFAGTGCKKDDNERTVDDTDYGIINVASLQTRVDQLPPELLSPDELASLIFTREEEKLARDVYIAMINKWGSRIFTNISTSEQTHMDAVLMLLKKYNLQDPVGSNAIGIFNNRTLQDLYNQLVAEGNSSVLAAYKVGATIEDLDIFDLTNALAYVDNQDIRLVYSMLTKGSRNHLRSFYANILKVGGTYTPIYITQAEFDAIIGSGMEAGF